MIVWMALHRDAGERSIAKFWAKISDCIVRMGLIAPMQEPRLARNGKRWPSTILFLRKLHKKYTIDRHVESVDDDALELKFKCRGFNLYNNRCEYFQPS